MSTEAQLPQAGEIVDGKYRVDSLLGKGGMGAVFVVRHVQTGRQFALKCMLADLIGDYEAEQRFIREAKLSGNVDHPGVVATYDIGRHRGSLYMVMELLSGEGLSARIAKGAFSVGEATHLMMTVLDAVAAAHHQGIVHRDLKPDNIFLHRAPDGRGYEPKILDFGISKALSPDGQPTVGLTKTGMMLGTPLYMSPEQVRGAKTIDQRTDIYALGVILYEMLTGTVPYNGSGFAELVLKIVTGDMVPPSTRVPSIPPALDAIVLRAMSPEQETRFVDAQSFARALAPFAIAPVYASQRPRPGSSAPPASYSPSTPPPSRAPSAPPPPQSLTPFASESRTDVVPVKPLPWPVFAVAAVLIGVGVWMWLADNEQAPMAEPGVPTTPATNEPTSERHAATPPATDTGNVLLAAPPTSVPSTAPTAPPAAADEIPMGVSPDAIPTLAAPKPIETHAPHGSHAHGHGTSPRQTSHAHTTSPAAPEAPVERERQRMPRPSDQIIDPFGD